jgi:hypothetical protein
MGLPVLRKGGLDGISFSDYASYPVGSSSLVSSTVGLVGSSGLGGSTSFDYGTSSATIPLFFQ